MPAGPSARVSGLAVDGLHQDALVVAARADFSDVALIAVVGRSVVEDEIMDAGGIDGVKLGTTCGAFGHYVLRIFCVNETPAAKSKTPPQREASVAVGSLKVRLRRHAMEDPPVNRIPSGHKDLGRIRSLLQLPGESLLLLSGSGHQIYGQQPKINTTGRVSSARPARGIVGRAAQSS